MPSASVDTTSALTGPETMDVISSMTCRKSRPSFAIRLGFVVTPAKMPHECTSLISSMLAVSMKNFITLFLLVDLRHQQILHGGAHSGQTGLRHRPEDALAAPPAP